MAYGVGGTAKKKGGLLAEALNAVVFHSLSISPSFLLSSPDGNLLLRLIRRSLLISIHTLLYFISYLPYFLPSRSPPPSPSVVTPPSSIDTTAAGRALSHVLSTVTRVPVASRKYGLIRSIAERILDDNLRFADSVLPLQDINCAALSAAFARTLAVLEVALASEALPGPLDGLAGKFVDALKSKLTRWAVAASPVEDGGLGGSAEKLAAEVLWLGQKMAESGVAADAVAMWGAASGLAVLAMSTQPRLQVVLVGVCALLFKLANSKQVEEVMGRKENGLDLASSRVAMLRSWLPLLCRACNGIDTSILSSNDKAETVRALEEMIEKLNLSEQEEVLSLWLHHFTNSAQSDWPNLESCYMRWYSESRKDLLKSKEACCLV